MTLLSFLLWLWVLLITAGIGGLQVNKTFIFLVGLAYVIVQLITWLGYSNMFTKPRK